MPLSPLMSDREREVVVALLEKVRDLLRSGEIQEDYFDMGIWLEDEPGCGTVGCVGGWIQKLFGVDYSDVRDLNSLFFPVTFPGFVWVIDPHKASPSEAADAIDRWISGEDPWPRREVVSRS